MWELAEWLSDGHLIVQPSDLRLNPPESYLFVQDGLIISCGVLYSMCYVFYMIRTFRDGVLAGPVELLFGNLAYEIYYAFVTTSTAFERVCFLAWFALDVTFVVVAVVSAVPRHRRRIISMRLVVATVLGVGFLHGLCQLFPDEREQVTAYWTGILLQLPIGWTSVFLLLGRGDVKGQSLEIWMTRFLGCLNAYAVFWWRYLNVPENWSYVGSTWSIAIFIITILPELVYPFLYIRVSLGQKRKAD